MPKTITNAPPTPAIGIGIGEGHSGPLQGPRIFSVSAPSVEMVSSFDLQVRVFFRTPRLSQLALHIAGSFHWPHVYRSDRMEIQVERSRNPTFAWRPVAR